MNKMAFRFAVAVVLSLLPNGLWANPSGAKVAAGSASVAGQGTSAVTITQASNLAIINWQTFSIATGQSTSFLQPSASSAALNRVLGGQTSVIDGSLTANGQIYLINGNGVVVGPGGVITANAFSASTRDISNADFLSGNFHFTGTSAAGVQNLGTIIALGGDVVLIGKTVDNEGTINAANGTAGLIAGDDVLLGQKNADGSTITVSPSALATSATGQVGVNNSGTINAAAAELKAANGNIYALAIQNSGTIRATTVKHQGGHIWLTSDAGTVSNSGTLNASATVAGGKGGTVTLKSAKGTVSHTGKLLAKGGPGGVGGSAEISGAKLVFTGTVDFTAPGGTTGDLLLDPDTLEIISSGATGTIGSLPSTGDSTINASDLVIALDGANITLQANDSISVNATVDASANGSAGNLALNTPTLNLNHPIILNGSLSGTATTVNVGASGLVQNGVDASSTTNVPTINLAAGATYALTSEVVINKSLNLDGNGAILDGSDGGGAGNGVTRVMEIDGTNSGVTVNLSNLTLENGNGSGANDNSFGGGLLIFAESGNQATVTILDSTITGNTAAAGGGIYSDGGSGSAALTISDSTVSDNSSTYNGGGIFNGGAGGSATLTISNSTVSGNTANSGSGGGILNSGVESGTATLTISDSTISGNTASSSGGGIYNDGSFFGNVMLTISSSTISGNSAGGAGGGIYNEGFLGTAMVTIGDTILAGNTAGGSEWDYYSDSGSLTDNGYNLFGNDGVLSSNGTNDVIVAAFGNSGDISSVLPGTESNGVFIPTLASNGGPTQTIALLIGSPAYLAGGPLGSVITDQRGVARGSTISIGAYDAAPSAVVNSNDDDGLIGVEVNGVVQNSLRDALTAANAGALGTDPTITFTASAGQFDGHSTDNTITLAQGELVIDSSLNLSAASVGGVTIDAGGNSRVLEIDGTNSGDTVNLSNLTLENGNGNGTNDSGSGGGLLVYATNGLRATVTISNSTISGNSAEDGGGIYNYEGFAGNATLTITNSTISGNSAGSNGGGVYNDGGFGNATLTITNSTISGNSAQYGGGGIYSEGVDGKATLTISGSTITGNSTTSFGGGIYMAGSGGTATLTIGDTILAGNTASGSESDYAADSASFTDLGYNLLATGGGITGNGTTDVTVAAFGNSGDISSVLAGTESGGKFLPTLANNGGLTQTIALLIGSSAIDAGGPNVGGYELDQRGYARPASNISIGAYEYNEIGNPFLVTTNVDPASGDLFGSLRTALNYANANPLLDPTITFVASTGEFDGISTDNTITLKDGELVIGSSLNLSAASVGGVTIDAGDKSRVMEIDGTSSGITVALSNLTLENGNGSGTNGTGSGGGLLVYAKSGLSANVTISNSTISGNSAYNGGGIYNNGSLGSATLTISNSTISGNQASNYGGGIYNDGDGGIYNGGENGSATLTISNSTISGNSTGYYGAGGGIYNYGEFRGHATLTISNSTISGNSTGEGGGIYNNGAYGTATLTINNSTISGNSASFVYGGGIVNVGLYGTATLTIGDTILAGNTVGGSESDYYSDSGSLTDNGYNLFGNDGELTSNGTNDVMVAAIGGSGDISSVLAGTESGSGSTLVFTPTLASNGGPTQTIALIIGSPAIDAGDPALIGSTDQRGFVRGSATAGTGVASDIGAYEAAIIDVTADNQEIIYGQSTPTLTYTVGSGPSSDLTGALALNTPETNAGTYTGDIGQGTLAATGYLLEFTAGTLTIDQRTVTVDPNSGQTKVYGATDPTLTYTSETATSTTGLVNSDSLSGDISYVGAGAKTNVGNYAFTTGTLANSNYKIVLETGPSTPTFAITKATLMINAGTSAKYYDGTTSSGGTPYVDSGLVTGDSVTDLSQSFESPNALGLDNSITEVNAGFSVNDGNGGGNYNVVLNTGTGTIIPATLTYTANPVSIHLNQPVPTLTGTVTGFVDGQNQGDATTGTLAFTTTATSSSPAGSYAIIGSGLTADNGNYVFVQAPGNALALTIGGLQFPPLGQPGTSFFNFSAQFDANANYNAFFTQSWFPLFDPALDGSLIPVFTAGREPTPVYTDRPATYASDHAPSGLIAFGSSFTVGALGRP